MGWLRLTDAVLVSGGGGGEAVGVGAGELAASVGAGIVPTLAVGLDFGDPAIDPITPRTTKSPTTLRMAVHALWRAGQLLRGGSGGGGCHHPGDGWPVRAGGVFIVPPGRRISDGSKTPRWLYRLTI